VRYEDRGVSAKWRRTLALAAAWIGVAAGGLAAQGLWHEHQANARTTENFAAFEALFPGDSLPVTATQLQRRLASKIGPTGGAESSVSMVDLMLRTTSVLGPNSELQSLRFRAKQMELTADVLISGFDELDAIKNRSQAVGIVVEVSDATAERDRVRARLKGTYL
jgi:type II secretory pathway component PulL